MRQTGSYSVTDPFLTTFYYVEKRNGILLKNRGEEFEKSYVPLHGGRGIKNCQNRRNVINEWPLRVKMDILFCFSVSTRGEALKVRLGEHDVTSTRETLRHEEYDVSGVVLYPGFDNSTLAHDIALIRLRHPAKQRPNIDVVCLPKQGSKFPDTADPSSRTSCVITGWGRRSESKLSHNSYLSFTI